MDFTPEEREYIDWKLKLAEETQKRSGNKTYTLEEVRQRHCKNILKKEVKKYRTI